MHVPHTVVANDDSISKGATIKKIKVSISKAASAIAIKHSNILKY